MRAVYVVHIEVEADEEGNFNHETGVKHWGVALKESRGGAAVGASERIREAIERKLPWERR